MCECVNGKEYHICDVCAQLLATIANAGLTLCCWAQSDFYHPQYYTLLGAAIYHQHRNTQQQRAHNMAS